MGKQRAMEVQRAQWCNSLSSLCSLSKSANDQVLLVLSRFDVCFYGLLSPTNKQLLLLLLLLIYAMVMSKGRQHIENICYI